MGRLACGRVSLAYGDARAEARRGESTAGVLPLAVALTLRRRDGRRAGARAALKAGHARLTRHAARAPVGTARGRRAAAQPAAACREREDPNPARNPRHSTRSFRDQRQRISPPKAVQVPEVHVSPAQHRRPEVPQGRHTFMSQSSAPVHAMPVAQQASRSPPQVSALLQRPAVQVRGAKHIVPSQQA